MQFLYGEGIAAYIQDIAGTDSTRVVNPKRPNSLQALPMMSFGSPAQYMLSSKWLATAAYSGVKVFSRNDYRDANTYQIANYLSVNLFYNLTESCQLGAATFAERAGTWTRSRGTPTAFRRSCSTIFKSYLISDEGYAENTNGRGTILECTGGNLVGFGGGFPRGWPYRRFWGDLDKIFSNTRPISKSRCPSLPSLLIIPFVLLAGKLSVSRNKLLILYTGLALFCISGFFSLFARTSCC